MVDEEVFLEAPKTCPGPGSVEGEVCGRKIKARGHCEQHYLMLRKELPLRPINEQPAGFAKGTERARQKKLKRAKSIGKDGRDWSRVKIPQMDHEGRTNVQLCDMREAYFLSFHPREPKRRRRQRRYMKEHRRDFMNLMAKLEAEFKPRGVEGGVTDAMDLGTQRVVELGNKLLAEWLGSKT